MHIAQPLGARDLRDLHDGPSDSENTHDCEPMTLLIVEPDKATAWTLSEGLARDGHMITTVTRGALAIREGSQNAYDACLLADDLPDMPSIAVLLALRDADPSLKILALLSPDAAPHTDVRVRLGATDSLTKPFSLATARASVVRLRDLPESIELRRIA